MSSSRAESQHPPNRRRSGTMQSVLRPMVTQSATSSSIASVPLKVGDNKTLDAWVHENKEGSDVIFNRTHWPGDCQGSLVRVTLVGGQDTAGFLFFVPRDVPSVKDKLQISVPRDIAEIYDIRSGESKVLLTKVDEKDYAADFIELSFQDQYLGRNEMWRLVEHLKGTCVYVRQELSYIGSIAARVVAVWVGGQKVSAGVVTSTTKTTFRSLSAKVTIFIQVCRELWEFAADGERYNEKIVHSFLPALFSKWREAGTNHLITIVLVSRVYYDQSEIDYAAGPLRKDEDGNWYKDFYKVITDLEVIYDWKPMLVSLKDSFWTFQRDILLTHHYHRATMEATFGPPELARLVGQLSFAHDGPLLEALNLGLNPMENHFIDRSLSLTGSATIVITPGTGYFRVNKQLLRLTTTRLVDQGFGVDLVSLAKPPLHQSPIFCFKGVEPELRMDRESRAGLRSTDPLWGGDDRTDDKREKVTFWWEPFWMSVSFWDKQMDLPFRQDRFVARAKMHQIQMLGLLDYDVLSSIEVPYLSGTTSESGVSSSPPRTQPITLEEAERFDLDTFALRKEPKPGAISRNSFASSGSATVMAGSWTGRSFRDSQRSSIASASSLLKIPPIEESPLRTPTDLPDHEPTRPSLLKMDSDVTVKLSTSPSQSSIRSVSTTKSSSTATTSRPSPSGQGTYTPRAFLNPLRLLNTLKNNLSKPETVTATASATTAVTQPSSTAGPAAAMASSSRTTSGNTTPKRTSTSRPPQPVSINHASSGRSILGRQFDDDPQYGHRLRSSPINTPPRDEATFGKRRSTGLSGLSAPLSSSPISPTNPLRTRSAVSYTQYALARRWQHIAPHPWYKHEIKWRSMVTPSCLPLSTEHFPSLTELETSYGVFSYDFVVDPNEFSSFLVRPPTMSDVSSIDEARRKCAYAVMRGMAAVRLAQGFQFVLRPSRAVGKARESKNVQSYGDEETTNFPAGIAEIFGNDTIYLSMSNEIHRISYTGEAIQVRRYVRSLPLMRNFQYECLIWPKLGLGYTEMKARFDSHGLEEYGWNRLDMLVAGYEHSFNESLKYWRTRFVVIPTEVPTVMNVAPLGEQLNEEEIRLLGMDKLAEMFARVRWTAPGERPGAAPPVRFLITDQDPALCVLDENIIAQLDQVHAAGPLKKKIQERYISEMTLATIAKAMREEDGVNIKDFRWHGRTYPQSFTGWDFVSWLLREFKDVSSREQGAEWGVKLQEQGLFDHSRGLHGFLDGHYYYQLKGEYAISVTPKTSWFRTSRYMQDEHPRAGYYPSSTPRGLTSPRKAPKRLILSQSMLVDVDPNKRSDQAECVVLHHDLIHNPATAFHFELHWIGTTGRCIEDLIHRQWSRQIEKYGLKLVEAYVRQISDIQAEGRNAFQSCCPIRLAEPPPLVPGIAKLVPEGTQTRHFFEAAMLRRAGFILDIEGADAYPREVDVHYSYRAWKFTRTQYVHRTGVAFAQIVGGEHGFLFLTNRLMVPGRMGAARKEPNPAEAADAIRLRLQEFCADKQRLNRFYQEEMEKLNYIRPRSEEPPELTI